MHFKTCLFALAATVAMSTVQAVEVMAHSDSSTKIDMTMNPKIKTRPVVVSNPVHRPNSGMFSPFWRGTHRTTGPDRVMMPRAVATDEKEDEQQKSHRSKGKGKKGSKGKKGKKMEEKEEGMVKEEKTPIKKAPKSRPVRT